MNEFMDKYGEGASNVAGRLAEFVKDTPVYARHIEGLLTQLSNTIPDVLIIFETLAVSLASIAEIRGTSYEEAESLYMDFIKYNMFLIDKSLAVIRQDCRDPETRKKNVQSFIRGMKATTRLRALLDEGVLPAEALNAITKEFPTTSVSITKMRGKEDDQQDSDEGKEGKAT